MPAAILAALLVAVPAAVVPAAADPDRWRAEGWKTDFGRATVDLGEIVSGGPPRDGIPAIDDPRFVAVGDATLDDLADTEPVIRLVIGGDARAYPLRILTWHEIVNDTVGGRPVAVTYCPLCNAAIAFERTVGGEVLSFGTTGKLRLSDLVMYDRQSESWWQQFTGEAIAGQKAGTMLDMIPVRVEAYGRFAEAFPQGRVLVPSDPSLRPYGRNPYVGYDGRGTPYPLYTGDLPDDIDPMVRVVVPRIAGAPFAVLLETLRAKGRIEVEGVTLTWEAGQNSALDTAAIGQGRDVGNVVVTGDGADLVHDVTFAFVYRAFHPDGRIVGD